MIYLDYNATTPVDKAVADAMLPYLYEQFGNPSSEHSLGQSAKQAVETARGQAAGLLNASAREILFTSGGSEANNMAIKGAAHACRLKGNHIITSSTEHPAVLNPCRYLEQNGYRVTYIPVDSRGVVDLAELERSICPETILVTIMHSNNETGTLQPIREIAGLCRRHQILVHTDASQSAGKVPLDVKELGVDMLTLAGHKLYAPKGIGALYIREGVILTPLIHGAGHENGRRAGTENVMFDVALGKACELASVLNDDCKVLTDYFYSRLTAEFGDNFKLNGHPEHKLPNTLNVSFTGWEGHDLLNELDQVAASAGSACHAGDYTGSPVLKAMGIEDSIARGAVRFSLGRYTTVEEIDAVMDQLVRIIKHRR
ncbi:cysteine desulfurase NifS [Paenibacillus sp. PK3_47]|uniref:cysteine desulfurase family protein n=1 Tax=Paenibacillus sp. PK3_47 TaxID=2072642 RepID=UPI00201DFD62|nr:cysteine desulfurase family protein [Paenibacillus sp. PK3_47]UQZ36173.1 cysteine desulfurase NifS [Paenibacillus sp. PK3_47]